MTKQKKKDREPYYIKREKFFDSGERSQILTKTEQMAIIDKEKGRTTWQIRYMLVKLGFYSGLRVSEITNLKLKHLHLGKNEPYIQVTKAKGNKSREVYIDKELAKQLKQFIELKKAIGQSVEPDAPLFAGQGDKHCTTTTLNISFKKAVTNAGLRDNLSIHSARHTYATFLYAKTKNLIYTKKQLGHASMDMTSLYADILPEENGKLADMMLD